METGSLGLGASLSIRGRRVVRGFALGPEFSVDQLYQFFLIEFVGSSILFLLLPEDSDRFAQLLQVQVGSPDRLVASNREIVGMSCAGYLSSSLSFG